MSDIMTQIAELSGHAISEALQTVMRICNATEAPTITAYLAFMMLEDAAKATRPVCLEQMGEDQRAIAKIIEDLHSQGTFQVEVKAGDVNSYHIEQRDRT